MELLHEEATQTETRRVVVRSKRTRDLITRSEPEPNDDAELYQEPRQTRQPPSNADFLKAAVQQSRELTRDGEKILFRRYIAAKEAGDQDEASRVRNQIVEANLEIVGRIARRKASNEREYLEAFSDAVMYLMRCVDNFSADGTAPFAAYVWICLKWDNFRKWKAELDRQARTQPIEDFQHPAVEYGDSREAGMLGVAMERLSDSARSLVQMKLDQPDSRQQQVAAELNMSTRNVNHKLRKAYDRLRHILMSEFSLHDSSPVVS